MQRFRLAVLAVVAMLVVSMLASTARAGTNEPIADNELGVTAKECAAMYCTEKDGLALWLSLVDVCIPDSTTTTTTSSLSENTVEELASGWSPVVVGVVCSALGATGLVFGAMAGQTYMERKLYAGLE